MVINYTEAVRQALNMGDMRCVGTTDNDGMRYMVIEDLSNHTTDHIAAEAAIDGQTIEDHVEFFGLMDVAIHATETQRAPK